MEEQQGIDIQEGDPITYYNKYSVPTEGTVVRLHRTHDDKLFFVVQPDNQPTAIETVQLDSVIF